MSKISLAKQHFSRLREKSIITISDIDEIGKLFYNYIKTAEEQFLASREISNFKHKIPQQTLAMENLSKPLALSNLIPIPLEKWHVDEEEFNGYLQVTKNHEFKYNVSAKYGTTIGNLKYKHWIQPTDLEMLDVIRQKYQQSDSDFPYNDQQAKRLALKLDKFLYERLYTSHILGLVDMYATEQKSIAKVRELALVKIFPFSSQYKTFAKSIDSTDFTYEELIIKAKSQKNEGPRFEKPFLSVIVADEENFQDSFMNAMKQSLNEMKIVDEKKSQVNYDEQIITGLKNIKTIIKIALEKGQ